jgi:hypothetical protein
MALRKNLPIRQLFIRVGCLTVDFHFLSRTLLPCCRRVAFRLRGVLLFLAWLLGWRGGYGTVSGSPSVRIVDTGLRNLALNSCSICRIPRGLLLGWGKD